ncbi:MAG: type II secretion system protein [Pirellulaceae bacterium]
MVYLFVNPATFEDNDSATSDTLNTWDPRFSLGWRGPYVLERTGGYEVDTAQGNQFTTQYGKNGDPCLLDAWQRPIVVQHPSWGHPTKFGSFRPVAMDTSRPIPTHPPNCSLNPTTSSSLLNSTDVEPRMAGCFPQYSRVHSSAWGRGVRRGLTLLELLIVIVILAVLATVAVRSLTPLADQARYETTMRTMENVRSAVVGNSDTRQVNATPMVSGFIADMGRRPVTRGTDAAAWLSELWQSPTFAGDANTPSPCAVVRRW